MVEEKKVYNGDKRKSKDIKYVLTIFQLNKRTPDFDEAINLLIEELVRKKFIDKDEFLQIRNDCIEEFLDGVKFSLVFPQFLSNMERFALNSIKKDVQLKIEKWTSKYLKLFGHYNYLLTEEEKKLPINVQKIIFELNQQVLGLKINLYENESLTKDELIKSFNKSNEKEIKWEISVSLKYLFFELDPSFYSKVKILSDYLMKKKLLDEPLDISDIKRRYEDAIKQIIESFKHNVQSDLAQKIDKSPQEIEELITDCVKNKIPKDYFFIVNLKIMSPEKFIDIQKELFDTVNINDFKPEYEILLTTTGDSCQIGYACYILSRQDLLK